MQTQFSIKVPEEAERTNRVSEQARHNTLQRRRKDTLTNKRVK